MPGCDVVCALRHLLVVASFDGCPGFDGRPGFASGSTLSLQETVIDRLQQVWTGRFRETKFSIVKVENIPD